MSEQKPLKFCNAKLDRLLCRGVFHCMHVAPCICWCANVTAPW